MPTIDDKLAKLKKAGLSDADKLPVTSINVLADMSDSELTLLAKARKTLKAKAGVEVMDTGGIIF